jgi:MraZ protein
VFFGSFEHTLDDKNRISIPAKWRAVFDAPAYLTIGPSAEERCIVVYAKEGFTRAYEEVRALGTHSKEARDKHRELFGNAHEVAKDGSGRLLVPTDLIASAGLDREVLAVGAGDWFEYWDKPTYTAYKAAREAGQ